MFGAQKKLKFETYENIKEKVKYYKQPPDKNLKFKYSTDVEKSVLIDNFEQRRWVRVLPQADWHFYWSSVQSSNAIFSALSRYRLHDNQIINHFPNHYELTRKDALARNIRRYRKELEKAQNCFAVKFQDGRYVFLDFMPDTFILPADYTLFVEEFRKNTMCKWIMKPCGRSRGAGIFLVDRLSQLRSWKDALPPLNNCDSYVISKYIENPLLIGGKKFDLRIYVLVTSFVPLKVYMFKHGFCRFCTQKYDLGVHQLDNMLIHLTNVSIQKQGKEYNQHHGGKWNTHNLRLYLEGVLGWSQTKMLFDKISWMIVHSLRAVAHQITQDAHCFECYGYDIIIDNSFKPWLIEVNAAPSLTSTTTSDRILKRKLISQIIDIVLPPNGLPDVKWPKLPARKLLTDFELLLDEQILQMQTVVAGVRLTVHNCIVKYRHKKKIFNKNQRCSNWIASHGKNNHTSANTKTLPVPVKPISSFVLLRQKPQMSNDDDVPKEKPNAEDGNETFVSEKGIIPFKTDPSHSVASQSDYNTVGPSYSNESFESDVEEVVGTNRYLTSELCNEDNSDNDTYSNEENYEVLNIDDDGDHNKYLRELDADNVT